MPWWLPFTSLVDAIPAVDVALGATSRLRRCDAQTSFVAPTFVADRATELSAEVLLVDAPAAVGKSTLAHQVAAVRGLPLLDLERAPIGVEA
jgi:hypothetical protein